MIEAESQRTFHFAGFRDKKEIEKYVGGSRRRYFES